MSSYRSRGKFKECKMTGRVGSRASGKPQGLEAAHNNKQLLPGIPNEVTLTMITPKVSYKEYRCLSSVSRGWGRAIRSREVYDTRVRLHSTETFLLLTYNPCRCSKGIALYSLREDLRYQMPPLPGLEIGRIPLTSQCVSLDGKIYVLGGVRCPTRDKVRGGGDGVYVLDLAAGGRIWKRCASMIEPRVDFGCGVFDGKIYVFGGIGNGRLAVCGSEVYDPVKNTWCAIKAMTRLRYDHEVTAVGAQLFVHGGKVLEPSDDKWEYLLWCWDVLKKGSALKFSLNKSYRAMEDLISQASREIHHILKYLPQANSLDVYDPVKDDCSSVKAVEGQETGCLFMAKGKLHSMSCDDIKVQNIQTNSWAHLHSHSFAATPLVDSSKSIVAQTALVVDDQLLVLVEEIERIQPQKNNVSKACLLRSRALGSMNEKIEWEGTLRSTIYFKKEIDTEFTNYSLHRLQL